jgi:hypothetical protein
VRVTRAASRTPASTIRAKKTALYGETGLLPPARTGANGHRFYDERRLWLPRQILVPAALDVGLPAVRAARFVNDGFLTGDRLGARMNGAAGLGKPSPGVRLAWWAGLWSSESVFCVGERVGVTGPGSVMVVTACWVSSAMRSRSER